MKRETIYIDLHGGKEKAQNYSLARRVASATLSVAGVVVTAGGAGVPAPEANFGFSSTVIPYGEADPDTVPSVGPIQEQRQGGSQQNSRVKQPA
ncbi:MAG TPA: hypothetical protein VG604_02710 [Candidatus Saccharimonadales bacterium]|nr:hypothetical protein [Candidatus Saccharimonadales bacterium]